MIPFFPKQIATKAIFLYMGALALVTLLFFSHAMSVTFIVMGLVWVVTFFALSSYCSIRWKDVPQNRFLVNVTVVAFSLRFVWVVFSYFFYLFQTGQPFEFDAADSLGYWEDAAWLSTEKWSVAMDYLFTSRNTVSDSGYLLYLTALYKIIGPNIFLTRVVKCFWSIATIVLLYRLTQRNMGEAAARLTAIFACCMPNLIIYCGLHLKETEMLLLVVAFLERTDYLIRSKRYTVWTIVVPVVILLSLFTFRTVLGIAGAFAFVTSLVFSTSSVIGARKRTMLIIWVALAALTMVGGSIRNEVEGLWEDRESNVTSKREQQYSRGNQWAKYATGAVMAPMMFVLPFPTMVNVDEQYNQQVLSGGNFVRNFMGGFVLIAFFAAIFVKKNWRNLSFIGAYVISYLGIISMSGFSNSERFLLPGLPVLLMAAAYGITLLNARNYRFIKIWYGVVFLMSAGWAIFKLGSRGLF